MSKHPLTQYRNNRGISQAEFAKSVGVNRWTINSVETGRRSPSFGLIARIVRVCGGEVSADDLVRAGMYHATRKKSKPAARKALAS